MKSLFLRLADFEFWSLKKYFTLFAGMAGCPEQASRLISHILNAQTIWLNRLTGNDGVTKPFDTIPQESWVDVLQSNHERWVIWLTGLSEESFTSGSHYANSKGDSYHSSIRDILLHLYGHSTYHRGQLSGYLKEMAIQIPVTDYIAMVRETDS